MNNIVIYTCSTGGYDSIKQPLTIYKDVDYICFSDDVTNQRIGVWQIKAIPYENSDNTRRARFVKHNPHIVVPEYEYSIWIDSNIQIVDNLLEREVLSLIEKGSIIAHIKHPKRDCIYQEALICARRAVDKFQSIYDFMKMIKAEGFPQHYGLSETNIIFRRHNDTLVKEVSEEWWELISKYSKRDQLSFYYILWRRKISIDKLLPDGIDTHSIEHFIRHSHKKKSVLMNRNLFIPFYIYRLVYLFKYKRLLSYDNL